MKISRLSQSAALITLALCACSPGEPNGTANGTANRAPDPDAALGLVTSLPIYWAEAGDITEALSQKSEVHWTREVLERDHQLEPLDLLSAETLSGLGSVAVIQPRALTPAENVALDDWVAGGGRLLLVLDPMLTDHSRFTIGDPRRPADVALIPPLFARWGLAMTFDDAQGEAEQAVAYRTVDLPVRLGGTLTTTPEAVVDRACTISAQGLVAECVRGEGRALIMADAALFEHERSDGEEALLTIIESAFGGG